MKSEDDRLVRGEERIEIGIREPMRVLTRRLQLHQIHDIDDAHLQLGRVPTYQINGRQRFQRRHVAAAGHHHIRLIAPVIAGPLPNPKPCIAVFDGLVHG